MPLAPDRAGTSQRNAPGPEVTRSANWRDEAACLHADPDLFFPIGTTGPALRQIKKAKRICQACPAQKPCLDWALDQGVPSGVWGGATEGERRAIRRALIRRDPSRAAQATTVHTPAS
jgi:WhiB family redox-sensing transcriptional regulator